MSSDENKQFYTSFTEQLSILITPNAGKFFDDNFTPDYRCHNYDPSGNEFDLPALRKELIEWGKDYRDLLFIVDDVLAEGDRVALRGHSTGQTKAGALKKWNFFAIARIVGMKLAEEWQVIVEVPVEKQFAP